MKKAVLLTALILCCLLALSSCSDAAYRFYKKNALAIEVECSGYSLKSASALTDGEQAYVITDKDYVSKDFLVNPDNDGSEELSLYNEGGLYVYIKNRKLNVFGFNLDRSYTLDAQYFRANSQAFNDIESIWAQKYGVEPSDVPNFIVGAVVFDGNIFVLAQNLDNQSGFDREHATNLWRFDPASGAVEFCGFCVTSGKTGNELCCLGDVQITIVKNA